MLKPGQMTRDMHNHPYLEKLWAEVTAAHAAHSDAMVAVCNAEIARYYGRATDADVVAARTHQENCHIEWGQACDAYARAEQVVNTPVSGKRTSR